MRLVALLALGVVSLCAETPAELEKLLATTAEPGIVMVEIARRYAIAGDRKQALAWFEKAAALNPEYTPEFDRDFEAMAALPEFLPLVERARKASPPVRRSALAFTVAESDLIPEGLAWNVTSKKLYLGSINKRKIVEIASRGAVRDFIAVGQDGLRHVSDRRPPPVPSASGEPAVTVRTNSDYRVASGSASTDATTSPVSRSTFHLAFSRAYRAS